MVVLGRVPRLLCTWFFSGVCGFVVSLSLLLSHVTAKTIEGRRTHLQTLEVHAESSRVRLISVEGEVRPWRGCLSQAVHDRLARPRRRRCRDGHDTTSLPPAVVTPPFSPPALPPTRLAAVREEKRKKSPKSDTAVSRGGVGWGGVGYDRPQATGFWAKNDNNSKKNRRNTKKKGNAAQPVFFFLQPSQSIPILQKAESRAHTCEPRTAPWARSDKPGRN